MSLTLVKKTQKDWKCNLCLTDITKGSMMIRENINRWQQFQFCLDCGKPKIEEALENTKKAFEIIRDDSRDNDTHSAHYIFKKDVEYFDNILKIINKKQEV